MRGSRVIRNYTFTHYLPGEFRIVCASTQLVQIFIIWFLVNTCVNSKECDQPAQTHISEEPFFRKSPLESRVIKNIILRIKDLRECGIACKSMDLLKGVWLG